MKTLVPMALFLGMVACGQTDQYYDQYLVSIDPAFSPKEVATVLQALEQWTDHTVKTTHPLVLVLEYRYCDSDNDPTPAHICLRRSSHVELMAKGAPMTGIVNAWTLQWGDRATCYIDMRATDEPYYLRHVVEHEIGHAMGLQHTKVNTVMNGFDDTASFDVTNFDIEQYLLIRN